MNNESDTKDIINQYIIFCKVFDEQRKLYGMTEQTVKETIRICKDRNILISAGIPIDDRCSIQRFPCVPQSWFFSLPYRSPLSVYNLFVLYWHYTSESIFVKHYGLGYYTLL